MGGHFSSEQTAKCLKVIDLRMLSLTKEIRKEPVTDIMSVDSLLRSLMNLV